MASGFAMNRHLDEATDKIALAAGQIDEVEFLVRVDDDDPDADTDIDMKFLRDDVRHVASKESLLKLSYLERTVSNLAHRLMEIRRRNDWVREDLEEPEAKVGAVIADDDEEARKEIKDGLRAHD